MIQAKLIVDGKEFIIIQTDFGISQRIDASGMPCSKPQNNTYNFKIAGTKENTFSEWGIEASMTKNCQIIFSPVTLGSGKERKIDLLDTYCCFYRLYFSSNTSGSFTESFSLTPGVVAVNGTEVMAQWWRKSKIHTSPHVAAITENETKPEVKDYYLTDLAGKRKSTFKNEEEILLIIKSKNMTGKYVTINLASKTHDFLYKGSILRNDMLDNYLITDDKEVIQLKSILEQKTK